MTSKDEWLYGRDYRSIVEKKWHPFPENFADFGPKLRRTAHGVRHWCPACNTEHHIAIFKANPKTQADWRWDGNIERPTFDPCVRASINVEGRTVTLCHYWIKQGMIEFTGECQHGPRTVEMPDWPIVTPMEREAVESRRLFRAHTGFDIAGAVVGRG